MKKSKSITKRAKRFLRNSLGKGISVAKGFCIQIIAIFIVTLSSGKAI